VTANQVFLLILVISVASQLVLSVLLIRWGMKWARVAELSYAKAVGLFLVLMFAGSFVGAAADFALAKTTIRPPATTVLEGIVQLTFACFFVAWIYKTPLLRAVRGLLPYCLLMPVSFLIAFAVRCFLYEGYSIPTNGMAPTLIGEHWEAPCPRCGAPAYGTPPRAMYAKQGAPPFPADGVPMVCSKELTSVVVTKPPTKRGDGDRLLDCKLLAPKRWDIIIFSSPDDPTAKYARRLVGLPGERFAIHDGSIWINEEKLEPSDSIKGIQYSPTVESNGHAFYGPGSRPLTLGPDEYFVLGDHVDGSLDSRFFKKGAPGHPPYAVPASYIDGVAINIYWPINRWTGFR
jgi:signal peptidase I